LTPQKNKKAETELETEIKKDMFCKMKVLGQFNLGFIIAQLDRDLFIIDQHQQMKDITLSNSKEISS